MKFICDSDGIASSIEVNRAGQAFPMVARRLLGTWGLIGDALPGGWEGQRDIELILDETNPNQWTIESVRLSKGEMKFRYANQWAYNYGDDAQDGVLDLHGANIAVQAGEYRVSINFSEGAPKYILEKKGD